MATLPTPLPENSMTLNLSMKPVVKRHYNAVTIPAFCWGFEVVLSATSLLLSVPSFVFSEPSLESLRLQGAHIQLPEKFRKTYKWTALEMEKADWLTNKKYMFTFWFVCHSRCMTSHMETFVTSITEQYQILKKDIHNYVNNGCHRASMLHYSQCLTMLSLSLGLKAQ